MGAGAGAERAADGALERGLNALLEHPEEAGALIERVARRPRARGADRMLLHWLSSEDAPDSLRAPWLPVRVIDEQAAAARVADVLDRAIDRIVAEEVTADAVVTAELAIRARGRGDGRAVALLAVAGRHPRGNERLAHHLVYEGWVPDWLALDGGAVALGQLATAPVAGGLAHAVVRTQLLALLETVVREGEGAIQADPASLRRRHLAALWWGLWRSGGEAEGVERIETATLLLGLDEWRAEAGPALADLPIHAVAGLLAHPAVVVRLRTARTLSAWRAGGESGR